VLESSGGVVVLSIEGETQSFVVRSVQFSSILIYL